MSKLIVEMEMPKNCPECHFSTACSFCEGYDDICVLAPKDAEYEWNFSDGVKPTERPTWCPIKGVLPETHGDLIDRDELKENFIIGDFIGDYAREKIDAAPTVIAAERKDDAK